MVDIIYLDIDGTIRDEVKGIPKSTEWAINQCHGHKIRVVICTGRNRGSIQDDVLSLPIDGIISGGGCYIQYQNHYLWKKHFSTKLINTIMKVACDNDLSLALEAEQKIYMDYNTSTFYKQDFQRKIDSLNENAHQQDIGSRHKIFYEDNFQDFQKEREKIHKVCILGQREAVNAAEKKLKQEVEVIQKKAWNNQWYLELLPKGCDKGSAVTFLNAKLGIPQTRSICFGDSENDIPMMKATGIAIAVGNDNVEIKKYASSMCEAVMEDGIYKELMRRNIIR